MPQVGRPPKPVEQKRKLGNPGQRRLPELASVSQLPVGDVTAPAHLADAGVRVWEFVTSAVPWFAQSDRLGLIELCDLVDLRAALVAQVRSDGLMVATGVGSMQAHPLLPQISALTKQIGSWLSLFGVSPADRSRLGAGEVKAASALEALKAKHRGGGS